LAAKDVPEREQQLRRARHDAVYDTTVRTNQDRTKRAAVTIPVAQTPTALHG